MCYGSTRCNLSYIKAKIPFERFPQTIHSQARTRQTQNNLWITYFGLFECLKWGTLVSQVYIGPQGSYNTARRIGLVLGIERTVIVNGRRSLSPGWRRETAKSDNAGILTFAEVGVYIQSKIQHWKRFRISFALASRFTIENLIINFVSQKEKKIIYIIIRESIGRLLKFHRVVTLFFELLRIIVESILPEMMYEHSLWLNSTHRKGQIATGTLQPHRLWSFTTGVRSNMAAYGWKYWWQSERSPRFVRWWVKILLYYCICMLRCCPLAGLPSQDASCPASCLLTSQGNITQAFQKVVWHLMLTNSIHFPWTFSLFKHTHLCTLKARLTAFELALAGFGIVYARRAGLTIGRKLASLAW